MNVEPAVPDKPELGATKIISGLITKVGSEVSAFVPTLFDAVTKTTTYLPSSEIVGT
jgi:hypothetical protein